MSIAVRTIEPVWDETDRLIAALPPGGTERRFSGSAQVLANARLAMEQDPVRLEHERWLRSAERQEGLKLIRAIRLARDIETCEAILRGERVPRSRLDPEWAKRYGL